MPSLSATSLQLSPSTRAMTISFSLPVRVARGCFSLPGLKYSITFLLKARSPVETGNQALKDPQFGSKMLAIGESLFFRVKADIEMMPVMTPQHMMKAGPAIEAAVKNGPSQVI